MKTSNAARLMLCHFEQGPYGGPAMKAYLCPTRKWTLGWGHTKGVKEGDTLVDLQHADDLLIEDLREFETGVDSLVAVPLKQNQFDALVLFSFNTGLDIDADTVPEGLGDSTLLKLVNAGAFESAALQFEKWVYGTVNGQKTKIKGLVRRRAAERRLFESGEIKVT